MNQDILRYKVKLLKAQGGISSYKELAEEYLDCNYKSLLNWLNNQFDYGYEKVKLIDSIVNDMLMPM